MDFHEGQHVHMVGVCGVGMAGVARLLASRGAVVSGCDSLLNELVPALTRVGVKVVKGHSPEHINTLPDDAIVVLTPAVFCDEPELVAARERGLPVICRGEVLASLVSPLNSIAVCGTHGKTTTACFTARLFQLLGADPGWCIGGFTPSLGTVADSGSNDLLIVEADESDATLRHYHPAVTVVNNIDVDHLEYFDSEDDLLECFRDVVRQTRKAVCVCADDKRALRVVRECGVEALDYGFSAASSLRADDVVISADGSSFELFYKDFPIGRISISVGGGHNVINALGAVAAAITCGYSVEEIVQILAEACAELPMRRFEELGVKNNVRYIADYAHHPVEIKAAVQMAMECSPRRVVAVFQPHRYTRTLAMGSEFPAAFNGVDEVILLPVYAASEDVIEGGDICDLYAHFRKSFDGSALTLADSFADCCSYLRRTLKSGDLVLIAGAGDVINIGNMLLRNEGCVDLDGLVHALNDHPQINASSDTCLEKFSVFPTRGCSVVADVVGAEAIAASIKLCKKYDVKWLAGGSGFNTLFSDCGLDECVINVERSAYTLPHAGNGFEGLAYGAPQMSSSVSEFVCVSCALSGSKLLEKLRKAGLSGLEFMVGIPGSVGGWLAMNAGAHGGCISDCVESVEIVNSEGDAVELSADQCAFSYRNCVALKNGFALSCRLRLKKSFPESVQARMDEWKEKRIPLVGLRTAGSVFRNPQGDFAGRLLDLASCKGLRIGGAYVADFHANIVVADDDCTASDIMALVMMMKNRVKFRSGIDLICEIRGIEV